MEAQLPSRSVEFFEAQFVRQVAGREFALNSFEHLALQHARGRVLDLGCGLGNLSLELARRGCEVMAVDASPTAIERIRREARAANLPVNAVLADLARWNVEGAFDSAVCIGLLMFLTRPRALETLGTLQRAVVPGGMAAVNVLIEGTTFSEFFDPRGYCLFGRGELEAHFEGWQILHTSESSFPAPGGTRKDFATVLARPPAGSAPSE
jgi:tellurite methyltransferase